MKKANFLISSFEKALNKPKTSLFKEFILCYRSSRSGFIFTDRSECNFAPYFIKTEIMNKLLAGIKKDIKRNRELKYELEVFNHFFIENIIIENKTKKIIDLGVKLGINNLSRQTAQVKCITATIFPNAFFDKMPEITKKFLELEQQISLCFRQNQKAVKTAIIDDFSFWYDKIMCRWHFWDLFYPNNKKILKRRIREIINTLSDKQPLPADFADGKTFKKPFFPFNYGEKYRARYVEALLYLSEKVILMRNYTDLLDLAHTKVQNENDFSKELQYFHNANYSPELNEITKMRNMAQSVYEKFAKICYLNAIVKSFEIFYSSDNPLEQSSALPTVAPDKEIKKIEKIVEHSKTIHAKGKLAKEYVSALKDFESSAENLLSDIEKYKCTSF